MDHSSNSLDDSNILRKRLLGAAVLIALAVIFLPLLLDGSGTESRFRRVEQLRVEPPRILNEAGQPEAPAAAIAEPEKPEPVVPAKPVAPVAPKPEESEAVTQESVTPASPGIEEPAEAATNIVLPTEPSGSEAEPEGQTTTAAGLPAAEGNATAWVIQAGSFSDEANALSVRDKIRAAGLPAFVSSKAESADSKLLYRVKVGPIAERQRAAAVQEDLQSLLGQKTLIRQYP